MLYEDVWCMGCMAVWCMGLYALYGLYGIHGRRDKVACLYGCMEAVCASKKKGNKILFWKPKRVFPPGFTFSVSASSL